MFGIIRLNRSIQFLLAASLISGIGTRIAAIATPLLALELTGSGLSISLVLMVRVLPAIVLGPFVGVMVDRGRRVTIMVLADLFRVAVFIAYPFARGLHSICLLTFAETLCGMCHMYAGNALMPSLVADRADLIKANSLMKSALSGVMLLGPLIGSVIIARVGIPVALLLNATTFLVSAVVLSRMPSGRQPAAERQVHRAGMDVVEGIRLVLDHRLLFRLLIVGAMASGGYGVVNVVLPLLATREFAAVSGAYGYIMSLLGAGLLLGSLASPWLSNRMRLTLLFGLGLVCAGIMQVSYSLAAMFIIALGLVCLGGIADGVQQVVTTTLLQTQVLDQFRGRVNSLFEAVSCVTFVGGLFAAGWLSDVWSVRQVGVLAGAFSIAMGLIGLVTLTRVTEEAVSGPST